MQKSIQPRSQKHLRNLLIIEITAILASFIAFVSMFSYIAVSGGVDIYIAIAPLCIGSYTLVMSVFVGFVMAEFSIGKKKHSWFWAIVGFGTTAGIIMILPVWFEPWTLYYVLFSVPIFSTMLVLLIMRTKINFAKGKII